MGEEITNDFQSPISERLQLSRVTLLSRRLTMLRRVYSAHAPLTWIPVASQ